MTTAAASGCTYRNPAARRGTDPPPAAATMDRGGDGKPGRLSPRRRTDRINPRATFPGNGVARLRPEHSPPRGNHGPAIKEGSVDTAAHEAPRPGAFGTNRTGGSTASRAGNSHIDRCVR